VEDNTLWIFSIIALVIGALIGFLVGRSGGRNVKQQELGQVQEELESYKKQVSGHFEETADLVNKMTESYRDVYKHLATSATTLCDATTAAAITSTLVPQLTEAKEVELDNEAVEEAPLSAKEEGVEAPRDYAPKKPDQEGTLSEGYGLKDPKTATPETEETVSAVETAETKVEKSL